jgi:AcrR family transcriptional regulator
MLIAFAEALIEEGYVDTSVADILQRAGVSRSTFYEHFTSKLDCFMHAFDLASDVLFARLGALGPTDVTDPVERFARYFTEYLGVLADHRALARVFLVDVYAAGPEAIERRATVQGRMAAEVARLLEVATPDGRFACELLVAAIGSMVTRPLVDGDVEALQALRDPVVAFVRSTFG